MQSTRNFTEKKEYMRKSIIIFFDTFIINVLTNIFKFISMVFHGQTYLIAVGDIEEDSLCYINLNVDYTINSNYSVNIYIIT